MGESPKKRSELHLRRARTDERARQLSALADLCPGVAFFERAAVVRIEALEASRFFVADDRRAGLLRRTSRRRYETRRLVIVLKLATPAKPLGEPHCHTSRITTKSTGSFLLVSRRITRARARGNPQSSEL